MFESVRPAKMFKPRSPRPSSERWYSEFVQSGRHGWNLGVPHWAEIAQHESLPVVVAIGSGKGGVGKSLVSANLGAELARLGNRTLVVDLDLGCANLHTYFGIAHPRVTVENFLSDPESNFLDLILPGPINGLGLVAGGRNDERTSARLLNNHVLGKLWRGIVNCKSNFNIDFVVLDLGAGTHVFTMELFSLAHIGIITVLPEPTSIENAYVFLKSHVTQLINNVGHQLDRENEAAALAGILTTLTADNLDKGYLSAIRAQYNNFPSVIKGLGSAVVARKLGILVNQTREREDRELGKSMEDICRRFFGLQAHDLGYLNYDESAWRSLRNQRLLVSDFPHSVIVQRLHQATHRLLSLSK